MIRNTLVLIIFFPLICVAQKKLAGIYRPNSSINKLSEPTLTLNCDSTMELNFSSDVVNGSSRGKWTAINYRLILEFDSINHPNQFYKGQFIYTIKHKQIDLIVFADETYVAMRAKAEIIAKQNNREFSWPSIEEVKKAFDKTVGTPQARTGMQSLKRVRKFSCSPNSR